MLYILPIIILVLGYILGRYVKLNVYKKNK